MKKEHKISFKKVFNKNKIKPKKSLGQNFLHDKNIIEIILSTADVSNRSVVEVGPGPCLLTEFLLLENAKVLWPVIISNSLWLSSNFHDWTISNFL